MSLLYSGLILQAASVTHGLVELAWLSWRFSRMWKNKWHSDGYSHHKHLKHANQFIWVDPVTTSHVSFQGVGRKLTSAHASWLFHKDRSTVQTACSNTWPFPQWQGELGVRLAEEHHCHWCHWHRRCLILSHQCVLRKPGRAMRVQGDQIQSSPNFGDPLLWFVHDPSPSHCQSKLRPVAEGCLQSEDSAITQKLVERILR